MTGTQNEALEKSIEGIGTELFRRMKGETPGIFNKGYWEGALLDRVMADPSFKVDMMRFIDVFSSLQTREQVTRHIREYLLRDGRELPTLMSTALKAAVNPLTAAVAQATFRSQIESMAGRFIVGRDARSALPELRKLHDAGFAFTCDLLGEAAVSEVEAEAYVARYLDLVANIADVARTWPASDIIDHNHAGPIPRTNVSLKISSMFSQIDPVDTAGSVAQLKTRLLPLFRLAREKNVYLNIDLEQHALRGITIDLFEELAGSDELRGWPNIAIVVQAYLRDSMRDAERIVSIARARQTPLGVRLVKGAYWDYETVVARQQGWPCPVFSDKAETDAQYERLTEYFLRNIDAISPAFASHNLRSLTHAVVLAKHMGIAERAIELQMLYGMAEPERAVFRNLQQRVRIYTPVGELLPGMAYLVRRLLENTSNSGFLRLSHHDNVDVKALLKRPVTGVPQGRDEQPRLVRGDLDSPFENCPLLDFSDPLARAALSGAIEAVAARFPVQVRPSIVSSNVRVLDRHSPNDGRLVARTLPGDHETVERTVARAHAAWPAWRDLDVDARAACLERLADRIEAERYALAALEMHEVGKPWREADADIAEAVDFCRYYARQARVELAPRWQHNVPGEENRLLYEGRGVVAVIAPWNFPLAILCGMATAALVAGNTVVIKPAEQSSAVGSRFFELASDVFPAHVVEFVPGPGDEVGAALVEHAGVAQVAFTGSREVGLTIMSAAATWREGQREIKRVVCEMGGKNAIIVDDDADLDEAVHGVIKSAFGFAGQKCSACSRVIVVGAVYDVFVARLLEAARSIRIGSALDAATAVPPVVESAQAARLRRVIDDAASRCRVLLRTEQPSGACYVPIAIFEVESVTDPLMQNELFGPVLAVFRARDFTHALEVANHTDYALTGAVYSRSPVNLDRARREFRVGNLYLNRGSTGALVSRQPFGGFAHSGGGTKAGGPGYLLHFANPRVVTENTMRRGFAPELG